MVRGKTRQPAELLSQNEITDLESQIKDLENALTQAQGYGKEGAGIDQAAIKRQIRQLQNEIDIRTPKTARGKEKDALVREELELEEQMSEGMPTDYEMRKPHRNPGAVGKHQQWLLRNNHRIERYRTIQKILRPMNPKSVEELRKDR